MSSSRETGQGLPVAVAGVFEVAQHHHHCKDDLALGLFLLWGHGALLREHCAGGGWLWCKFSKITTSWNIRNHEAVFRAIP